MAVSPDERQEAAKDAKAIDFIGNIQKQQPKVCLQAARQRQKQYNDQMCSMQEARWPRTTVGMSLSKLLARISCCHNGLEHSRSLPNLQ